MFKQNVVKKWYTFYLKDLTSLKFMAESLPAARLTFVANEYGTLDDVFRITESESENGDETLVYERE